MSSRKMSFEESLNRLDEIVRHLEKGDLPLSESLVLFEEGTALISRCSALLDSAEQQVVRLKKGEDGAPVELPFDQDEFNEPRVGDDQVRQQQIRFLPAPPADVMGVPLLQGPDVINGHTVRRMIIGDGHTFEGSDRLRREDL